VFRIEIESFINSAFETSCEYIGTSFKDKAMTHVEWFIMFFINFITGCEFELIIWLLIHILFVMDYLKCYCNVKFISDKHEYKSERVMYMYLWT